MATTIGLAGLLLLCASAAGTPEKGQWSVTIPLDKPNSYVGFPKHMYKGSKVSVTVKLYCSDFTDPPSVQIAWNLRVSPCAMEFLGAEEQLSNLSGKKGIDAFSYPVWYTIPPYDEFEYIMNQTTVACVDGHPVHFDDYSEQEPVIQKTYRIGKNETNTDQPGAAVDTSGAQNAPSAGGDASAGADTQTGGGGSGTGNAQAGGGASGTRNPQSSSGGSTGAQTGEGADKGQQTNAGNKQDAGQGGGTRKKRAAEGAATPAPAASQGNAAPQNKLVASQNQQKNKPDHPVLATTWKDGNYLFILRFTPLGDAGKPEPKFTAEVQVRMTWGDNNYLSALDYPLLVFYGVLGLLYIFMGLFWLVLLACNWRDLLRVQFWIGGVIFLGMLEKAVFFAEYENVNKVGVSVSGAVIFAELVSCLKRTLARMLVIIVSLGFGIVKPRLGQAFHKVLFVGALFFILAAIEGCMRATSSKVDQSNQFLLAAVPLAVLDAVICWWIFSSLVQTTRTLRLRRNIVKLTLYRHFTNTLIFAVLASVAYMIWFMTQHKFQDCIKDWKQLWVDEAFWHMLFIVLVFIIMLLWRPTANNQRYAFSPLLDAAEEEEEDDAVMNDAFEGMKMRGVKAANGSPKQRDAKNKVEDDLKWVEEHIPSSVADKALPSLLDSDEELMTTKFEMSKME